MLEVYSTATVHKMNIDRLMLQSSLDYLVKASMISIFFVGHELNIELRSSNSNEIY